MLAKEEYRFVHHKGRKFVLCERLDMMAGMEEELLRGTRFAYKCPPDRESALEWKRAYEEFSKRSFTVTTSYFRKGVSAVYMGRLCCKHRRNKRPRRKTIISKRDFGCPYILKMSVRVPEGKRSQNPTKGGYNLRIFSNQQEHTHSLEDVLKYRRMGDATRAELMALFDEHHTPTSAMEELKLRLFERLGDRYLAEATDRAVLPDKGSVLNLFYETYHDRYGDLRRRAVRRLQQDAARRRRRLAGSEDTQPPVQDTREPAPEQPSRTAARASRRTPAARAGVGIIRKRPHSEQEQESENDDNEVDDQTGHFMESFDATEELHTVNWGDEIPFDSSVTVIPGDDPSQPGTDEVSAAVASVVTAPDHSTVASVVTAPDHLPSNVIVCYGEDGLAGGAGTVIVEPAGGVSLEEDAGEILVGTVDVPGQEAAVMAGVAVVQDMTEVGHADVMTSVSGVDGYTAILDSGIKCEPPSPDPRLEGERVARGIAQWASDLAQRLVADDSGEWRAASEAFLQNWSLLPPPGQVRALGLFGRVTGLGKSANSQTNIAKPTETVATQTDPDKSLPKLTPGTMCFKREPTRILTEQVYAADADYSRKPRSVFVKSLCVLRNGEEVSSVPNGQMSRVASMFEGRNNQISASIRAARKLERFSAGEQ